LGIEWGRDNAVPLPIEADPKTDRRVPKTPGCRALAGTSGSRLELISKDHAPLAPVGRRAVELFLRKVAWREKAN
jgi:hypothetical protein